MKRAICLTAAAVAALILMPAAAANGINTKKLRNGVTVDGIMAHQRAFQQIATQNDGTRAAGSSGQDASVDYVVRRMRRAGYRVRLNEFDFPTWEQNAPTIFEQVSPDAQAYVEGPEGDFVTAVMSGAGTVEAPIVTVGNTVIPPPGGPGSSVSGCDPADYPADTAGKVALVQRGTCPFVQKVQNAKDAEAAAVIIFNDGFEGRTAPPAYNAPPLIGIPALAASSAVGEDLYNAAQGGEVMVRIVTDTTTTPRAQYNVLADSREGDPDRTIVVGGHLDSVEAGPGINDNGSGSSSLIEIAEQIAELKQDPRNRLRFAWWGAEEPGLIGSTAYVNGLTPQQISRIAMNLNFDMLASPNFVRFVYDGDTSDTPPPPGGAPPGSGRIEQEFLSYFSSQGLASTPTAFDGRSDYGPFIAQGIPAGGLFSGAEGEKTPEEAAIYGGTAGLAYDPCYHAECDTIQNLSTTALGQMADAAAHTTWTFARSKEPIVGALTAKKSRSADARAERRGGLEYRGHLAYR